MRKSQEEVCCQHYHQGSFHSNVFIFYNVFQELLGANPAPLQFYKVLLDTTMAIHACIHYSCFCFTKSKLSSWGRDHLAHKAYKIYYLYGRKSKVYLYSLYGKSVSVLPYFTVNTNSTFLSKLALVVFHRPGKFLNQ